MGIDPKFSNIYYVFKNNAFTACFGLKLKTVSKVSRISKLLRGYKQIIWEVYLSHPPHVFYY